MAHTSEPSGPIVGIDLGTTFSGIAFLNAFGRAEVIPTRTGEREVPSVVLFPPGGGEPIVGRQAKERSVEHPERVVEFVKREMGDPDWRFRVDGKELRPPAISSIILRTLLDLAEERLGQRPTSAVITVPAYFGDLERQATADAGRLAGLEVLSTFNEPTAAALAYGLHHAAKGDEVRAMVYDLGGGTFDVTVLELQGRCVRVLATAGEHRLGGKDWDDELVNYCAEEFAASNGGLDPREDLAAQQDLRNRAEAAKVILSSKPKAAVFVRAYGKTSKIEVTRSLFEEITRPLLVQTKTYVDQVLAASKTRWEDIDVVLPVGGSSYMPQVRELLRQASGRDPEPVIDPELAVVQGACYYAALHRAQQGFEIKIFAVQKPSGRIAAPPKKPTAPPPPQPKAPQRPQPPTTKQPATKQPPPKQPPPKQPPPKQPPLAKRPATAKHEVRPADHETDPLLPALPPASLEDVPELLSLPGQLGAATELLDVPSQLGASGELLGLPGQTGAKTEVLGLPGQLGGATQVEMMSVPPDAEGALTELELPALGPAPAELRPLFAVPTSAAKEPGSWILESTDGAIDPLGWPVAATRTMTFDFADLVSLDDGFDPDRSVELPGSKGSSGNTPALPAGPRRFVQEVNARALGVLVYSSGKPKTSVMIPANSPLPATHRSRFFTIQDRQTAVKVVVLEGESADPSACVRVGECVIQGLPARPKGQEIEIAYTYDHDGRIQITARDVGSGQLAQATLHRAADMSSGEATRQRSVLDGMFR